MVGTAKSAEITENQLCLAVCLILGALLLSEIILSN